MAGFQDLPPEIITLVLHSLDTQGLKHARLTCRSLEAECRPLLFGTVRLFTNTESFGRLRSICSSVRLRLLPTKLRYCTKMVYYKAEWYSDDIFEANDGSYDGYDMPPAVTNAFGAWKRNAIGTGFSGVAKQKVREYAEGLSEFEIEDIYEQWRAVVDSQVATFRRLPQHESESDSDTSLEYSGLKEAFARLHNLKSISFDTGCTEDDLQVGVGATVETILDVDPLARRTLILPTAAGGKHRHTRSFICALDALTQAVEESSEEVEIQPVIEDFSVIGLMPLDNHLLGHMFLTEALGDLWGSLKTLDITFATQSGRVGMMPELLGLLGRIGSVHTLSIGFWQSDKAFDCSDPTHNSFIYYSFRDLMTGVVLPSVRSLCISGGSVDERLLETIQDAFPNIQKLRLGSLDLYQLIPDVDAASLYLTHNGGSSVQNVNGDSLKPGVWPLLLSQVPKKLPQLTTVSIVGPLGSGGRPVYYVRDDAIWYLPASYLDHHDMRTVGNARTLKRKIESEIMRGVCEDQGGVFQDGRWPWEHASTETIREP